MYLEGNAGFGALNGMTRIGRNLFLGWTLYVWCAWLMFFMVVGLNILFFVPICFLF